MGKTFTRIALVLSSLSLGACGGGGSDAGSPIQVAGPGGTPSTPNGTTTSPPAITYPKGPSAVASPTEFALLDALYWSGTGPRVSASDISLRWLGQPATYGMKVAGIGEGELRQVSANDPALRLVGSGGQVVLTSVDIPQSIGRYSGILYRWGNPFIAAAFGVPTSLDRVPTTGTKAYRPLPQGYTVTLDFDFATRRITGTIGLAWIDDWGPYSPTIYSLTPTTLAAGETSFAIPFEVPGAPQQGLVVGRLTGPDAEELMLSWRGQMKSPYDDSWQTQGGVTVLSSAS